MNERRSVCRRGHARTPGNLLFNGKTYACAECARITRNRWKATRRAKRRAELGLPPVGALHPCPQGHGSEHRRPGRYDCAVCHRDAEVRRSRANGVAPKPPPKTREQRLADKRRWEGNRKAWKMARFIEDVRPAVVYERCGGKCGICGSPVDRQSFEVDHIIPLSRGGEHSYANTQAAHRRCNRKKWALLPHELSA